MGKVSAKGDFNAVSVKKSKRKVKTALLTDEEKQAAAIKKKENMRVVREECVRLIMMTFACAFYALSLYAFLVPNHIVGGGMTGIGTILYLKFGFPIGLVVILANIPILLLGFKMMGWKFILHCFITITTLGIITDLVDNMPAFTDNPLLAAMYGGITQGIGVGIFIKYRVSSGGTELLGRITKRIIPVGTIATHIAVLDGIIVICGSIVTQSAENVLYALILIFIASKVSDVIVYGLAKTKLCYIITDKGEELANFLVHHSPRGVTELKGVGAYTDSEKGVLLTCVKDNQVMSLKKFIKSIDPNAFVIICESREAYGKGFSSLDDDNKL